MIVFDTDVLTAILLGNPALVERAAAIPVREQAVPVIVIEEIMRGRLNVIRQAEAGRANVNIAHAYELFEETFTDFRRIQVLSYTSQADALYQQWRQQGIRIATHDLRIAATCVAHAGILISRNRLDFERVPGLRVEFWE
ncbi:MAG TPA: type II toxin-antitoxin system VapC family toxin [Candidatus Binatia bacterium]|nr:type II toxin-antitoxin system VapC family toxin [Candidatus Binatia bacterium]